MSKTSLNSLKAKVIMMFHAHDIVLHVHMRHMIRILSHHINPVHICQLPQPSINMQQEFHYSNDFSINSGIGLQSRR